jgi:hypothetical protein
VAKLGDLFHIGRLKRRLIAGPLPNPLAFFYFFLVTGFDGLQLAILDSTSHSPGPWGPPAVWASFAVAVVFLLLAYRFNGGASGSDFLPRYFSISAVIGLYTAGPLQILLRLPHWLPSFDAGPGYAPALVLGTNLLMFSLILFNLRDVARRTPGGGIAGLRAS